MKLKTKRLLWEAILYLLLATAAVLLVVNYLLFRTDAGECVRDPKMFLIDHFEKLTDSNISCTCTTDRRLDKHRGAYKITFSSQGIINENYNIQDLLSGNISIVP